MQAIICSNDQGLVLASDRLMVTEQEGTQTVERRVYTLSAHTVILTSGAAVGVELSQELSQWLQARHLEDFDDVVAVSRDFLAQGYARHLRAAHSRQGARSAGEKHLYFAIGGYSSQHAPSPYVAILLHSEGGDLPFKETQLPHVFTLPRKVVLEGRITRQVVEGAGLRTLAAHCLSALQGMAERNAESIGGPFDVAVVRASGVEFLDGAELLAETEEADGADYDVG